MVDWGNDRVQKFSADGQFLMSVPRPGESGADLNRPADVAVDSEGDIYVTDWGNNRVQIYDPDGSIITSLYGDATVFSKWAQEVVDSNPDVVKAYRRVRDLTPLGKIRPPAGDSRRRGGPDNRHGYDEGQAAGVRQRQGLHGPAVQPLERS